MLLLSVDTRKRDTWGCRGALRSLAILGEAPKISPLHHCDRCERGVGFWWFEAWVSIGFSSNYTDLDARDGWLKA
jgi:hypothetical protein